MFRTIARTYRAAFSGLPRDVWMLSAVALINRAGSMVLPFITLYLTQELGLSIFQAGLMLSLYGIGSGVGAYLGGWLTDRFGSMRTMQLSLFASGAGFLAFTQLRSLTEIAVGILVLSVIAEGFRPAVMTATAEHAPPGLQAKGFALLRLAVNLGVGVGPAVGGFLALFSYNWLFVVDALTCWIAAVLMPILVSTPAGEESVEARAARPRRSPWSDGPFLLLLVHVTLMACVIFQVLSTWPLHFRQVYGYFEDTIGLCLGFNAFLIVAFEMVLIHWAERKSRMLIVGVGSFLLCAGFGLMPLGSSLPFVLLTVFVCTVGEMLTLPLVNAVVAERSGSGSRGRYMGLYMMSFSLAFMVGPVAGTYVFETYGPDALWYGVGSLGIPLMLLSLILRRSLRRPAAGP